MSEDILQKVLTTKAEEVSDRRRRLTLDQLRVQVPGLPPLRDFAGALAAPVAAGGAGVIAEIKRASPSAGLIREDFSPSWLAARYEAGGAACLSVLTDQQYFQGNEAYLLQAREACSLPVLRKEFIVDEWQVWETRGLMADAILLIAAVLDDGRLRDFSGLARELGMSVLVEVHDARELHRALELESLELVGINNRNLRTFETRLETSLELAPAVPGFVQVVAESGIRTPGDIQRLAAGGVHRFLVGESLMRAEDPGAALEHLIGPA